MLIHNLKHFEKKFQAQIVLLVITGLPLCLRRYLPMQETFYQGCELNNYTKHLSENTISIQPPPEKKTGLTLLNLFYEAGMPNAKPDNKRKTGTTDQYLP